jgi:hypothetical protein
MVRLFSKCMYRILLIIPITIASTKTRFLKLKLIKLYLRSAMSQNKKCGLVILSTEIEILAKLEHKTLISNLGKLHSSPSRFGGMTITPKSELRK